MIELKGVEIAKIQKGDLTSQDLDDLVETFDPKQHEVPITIGHPEHNKPAYGWLRSVYRKGNQLFSDMGIHATLKKALDQELFKTRSISFYRNFKNTGKKVLRHLGFLGAMPPQIKGMEALNLAGVGSFSTVNFDEDEDFQVVNFTENVVNYEEDRKSRYGLQSVGQLFQELRDFIIEKYDKETADRILSQWSIDQLKDTPLERPESELFQEKEKKTKSEVKKKMTDIVSYSEEQVQKEINAELTKQKGQLTTEFKEEISTLTESVTRKDKEIKELNEKLTEKDKSIETLEKEKVDLDITSFVDGLIKEGKLEPAEKDEIIEILSDKDISASYREKLKANYKKRKVFEGFEIPEDFDDEEGVKAGGVSFADIVEGDAK